jgi:SAM-dependent methyltransferase
VGKNQKIKARKKAAEAQILKLDFGCGKTVREGFEGVDIRNFGQKHVVDLRKKWPWKDGSVDQAHCSHFVEHMKPAERVHFVNELYRVLKPEGECLVITPHWASQRAYGDLTHEWPPVSEFWFFYLKKEWRDVNAPHNDGYTCNFEVTWGYNLHPSIVQRNQEYQQEALQWSKEAAMDTVATFKRLEMPKK